MSLGRNADTSGALLFYFWQGSCSTSIKLKLVTQPEWCLDSSGQAPWVAQKMCVITKGDDPLLYSFLTRSLKLQNQHQFLNLFSRRAFILRHFYRVMLCFYMFCSFMTSSSAFIFIGLLCQSFTMPLVFYHSGFCFALQSTLFLAKKRKKVSCQ